MADRDRFMHRINAARGRAWLVTGLASVLLAGMLTAAAEPSSAAADLPAPVVSGDAAATPPTAPDLASAAVIARLEDTPVEAVGERTEVSSTWAMPDGTVRSAQAGGQVWVPTGKGDGSEPEDWEPLDLRLEATPDGPWRAAMAGVDTMLSGGASATGWVDLVRFEKTAGPGRALQVRGPLRHRRWRARGPSTPT